MTEENQTARDRQMRETLVAVREKLKLALSLAREQRNRGARSGK
jgi:hypothetical protein